ncbi:hypothetical protein JIN85_14630 [Luteolibacter pohnpeiensis]|uniref:BIG2 domain-containing protein n=1 Tax=Luteolibacter pohnpeiensis TaxID=454153 RepID=A0A934VXM7_9BACT|nr:hypothetical protein [Luteolibacter pohnpeiensis]MBK1883654.1 hypothetical protein [Luteolibacter pohnpeiensis]
MNIDDAYTKRTPLTTIDYGARITWDSFFQPILSSKDPDIATVDSIGNVTRVSDGTARILAVTGPNAQQLSIPVARVPDQTSDEFISWVSGSLAAEASLQIDVRISGKDPESSKAVYSSQNHATGEYTRSLNCWLTMILTGVSPWNSTFAGDMGYTAITPRHIITANHFPQLSIFSLRFVTADNVVVTRTCISSIQIGTSDIRIYILDEDLPETISPVKIAPGNLNSLIPTTRSGKGIIPVLAFNQDEDALILGMYKTSDTSFSYNKNAGSDSRNEFAKSIIPGDSGNPVFLIINNEPALISTFHTTASGPLIPAYISEINNAIATLDAGQGISTGYSVTVADFTSFPVYS